MQFAGMGLLVPFYAGNFADKNLPGSDSARIGLVSSVASFVFTWAVRMSPMELSSGVVAVTVLFLMLSLGEEVGDDSVPLGVYSVPGLVGNQWGWPWMQTLVRSLLRNLAVASRSDARRIALLLLVNLVAMVVMVAVGLYQWNNRLLALALRLLFSCTILGIGLIGTIIKYSRASLDFSYGYTRFETLCGFTNALLLVFTSFCGGLEDMARLMEYPDKAVLERGRDPAAPGVSVWISLAALVLQVFSFLFAICAGGWWHSSPTHKRACARAHTHTHTFVRAILSCTAWCVYMPARAQSHTRSVCACAPSSTHAREHSYLSIYLSMHACMHAYIYLSTYLSIYLCMHACMHLSINLSIYLSMHACMHTSIYQRIYPARHTHTMHSLKQCTQSI